MPHNHVALVQVIQLVGRKHQAITYDILQCHMSIKPSQITSHLDVCSTACLADNKENIKVPHCWPIVKEIIWWLVDHQITSHREITPTGLCGPRFHAPLHIFPPPPGPAGGPSRNTGKGALVGGIWCNFANIGPRNSIQLLIPHAMWWECQF